ncbi:type I-E CRISPR-associated protein Cas6/Cse3/CasE [Spongiibacter sp. KMU-158]|uniref:Type I-E CRISPR-associated protein Cas6/Cse3/CasE n=1 Tax=Spongiibacter pelagi TaxID=2760804 RepID=A0A927C182_9GAMM|nr:type I-E CRISPR-associated protein Cas6/Cse3/CasE [Spongiibacter pelagi]MBD2858157.1 type I-E CRISPR-associated protein Cas6/Cse3/CasE [Spongiibacter pelagi]
MSMIASVLHLDRRAVKTLRITDAYSLHRVVYSLYEDVRDSEQKQAGTASGILYADQGGDNRGRKILMLANREPMLAVEGQHGEVLSKPIPDNFLEHDQYRFKVIVNPTRRDSATRKLVAVRGRDAVAQWFAERATNSWGFEIYPQQLQVDKIEVLQFKDKHKRSVTIGQAHVQGLMRITDREQFNNSFTQGIGRARAYGCGLLQVVPIIENPFV